MNPSSAGFGGGEDGRIRCWDGDVARRPKRKLFSTQSQLLLMYESSEGEAVSLTKMHGYAGCDVVLVEVVKRDQSLNRHSP